MYIGYADRYVSSYAVRRERKIGKAVKVVLLVLIAFVLGCVVTQIVITLGTGRNMSVEKENRGITTEDTDGTVWEKLFGIFGEGVLSQEMAESEMGRYEGNDSDLYVSKIEAGASEGTVMMHEITEGANVINNLENVYYVSEEAVIQEEPDTNLVIIDPGHGGEDEGCSHEDVLEKDINLALALALCDKLEERGFEVLLTRNEDVYLTLEERVEIVNASKGDFLISIHQNAYEEKQVQGIETWYNGKTSYGKESKRLAQLVQQRVILYTEGADRGIVENEELLVIREAAMPSCLVETGFLSNAEERAKLMDAAYQEKVVEGLAAAVELYFFPRTMYLTFDDGPSAEHTNAILDTLKERDVKATFFVIGENVRKHPEVARRILEEGHTIGIHCNWHDYDMLYESVESYATDFEQAQQIVYEVTGVQSQIFRFPGGSINSYNKKVYEDIIEEMTGRGYVYYDWNASLEDAVGQTQPEQLIANAKESTLGRKKIIMLAHDTVYNTALCLEELLEQFPEYRFEALTAEVEPIQF